jgi:hypothetical protein
METRHFLSNNGQTREQQLHSDTCDAIERFLLHPQASEEELAIISGQGVPGLLITECLRFCYNRPSSPVDQAALTNKYFPENRNTNPCLPRLLWTIASAKEVALSDIGWKDRYLSKIREIIRGESEAIVAPTIALLQAGGDLAVEEADRVFEDFARNHGPSHEILGRLLVDWPGLLGVDRRDKTLESSRRAIAILSRWSGQRSGGYQSAYPFLFFPLVEFVLSHAAHDEAVKAYLKGLSITFSEYRGGPGAERGVKILADFELLLKQVPDAVWAEVHRVVVSWHDPRPQEPPYSCHHDDALGPSYLGPVENCET